MGAAEDLAPENQIDEIEHIDRQLGEGKYKNIRKFTEGGTRTLYKAEWGPAEETVIIKADKDDTQLTSPRAQRHAERGYITSNEISVLALIRKLEGPERYHIQRIYDFNADCTISVEPEFESQTLEEMVDNEGPLTSGDFRTAFTQLMEFSQYLINEAGLFHRDLKPSNILVGKDKQEELEIRVVDFANGCRKDKTEAKMMPTAGGHLVMDPLIIGKFNAAAEGKYDEKSEIYAIGTDMAFALTGEYPVEYEADKGFGICKFTGESLLDEEGNLDPAAHDRAIDAFLAKELPRHARRYRKIIKNCLTLDEKKRYKSIDKLAREFDRANTSKKPFIMSIATGLLIGAAAVGGFGLAYHQNIQADEHAQELRQFTRDEETRRKYEDMFKSAYSFVEQSIIDGKVKNDLVFEHPYFMLYEQEEIVGIAKRHDLEPGLIARILLVNKLYSRRSGSDLGQSPVYLFDPIETRKNMYRVESISRWDSSKREPSNSPAKILDEGAERLAGLIRENDGDIEKALTGFYSPVYPQKEGAHSRWWLHGTYTDDIAEVIDQEIEIIVHNVINGPGAGMGGYHINTLVGDYIQKRYAPLQR